VRKGKSVRVCFELGFWWNCSTNWLQGSFVVILRPLSNSLPTVGFKLVSVWSVTYLVTLPIYRSVGWCSQNYRLIFLYISQFWIPHMSSYHCSRSWKRRIEQNVIMSTWVDFFLLYYNSILVSFS
jgi:hypothetical protein